MKNSQPEPEARMAIDDVTEKERTKGTVSSSLKCPFSILLPYKKITLLDRGNQSPLDVYVYFVLSNAYPMTLSTKLCLCFIFS